MTTRTRRLRRRVERRAMVAAVAVLGAAAAGCGEDTPAELAGLVQEPNLDVGDVALPTVGGDETPMRADDGELLVVYFGFTYCPDVCPTTLYDIGRAIDELDDEDAARITAGMVTVDPERDTDEVLTAFLGSFFASPVGWRETDPGELLRDAERFGVTFQVEEHDAGDAEYDVGHTPIVFVIDDTGHVRVQWPDGFERESMVADLELLLDESAPIT